MNEPLKFKDLFQGLFGAKKSPTPAATMASPDTVVTAIPFPVKSPKPRSEAYLNRRTGFQKDGNFKTRIGEYLAAKGETTTAEMIRDLQLPKSSLIYHLNQILEISQMDPVRFKHYRGKSHVEELLGGKRLERVGGSKYVKYRLVEHPQKPIQPYNY